MNKTENILTDIFNLKLYIENKIENFPTRFNIVDSIVGAHKETSNTKLLGNFLDCTFEKNYKFVNSLLEYVKNNCTINNDSFKKINFYDKNITVNIEKEVLINIEEKGRIDILLTSDEYNIIIENKINIRDRENQLQKYYNAVYNGTKKNTYVIYLTPNGDEPQNNFDSKESPILLSHKTIIDWLESIKEIDEIKNNNSLFSAITQIIETEQIITNLLEENMQKKAIEEYFEKNKELFNKYEIVADYANLLQETRKFILDKYYEYFENNIKIHINNLKLFFESKKDIKNKKVNYEGKEIDDKIKKGEDFCQAIVELNTKSFQIVFEFGRFTPTKFCIYYGIKCDNDENRLNQLRNIKDEILNCFTCSVSSNIEENIESGWYVDYTLNLNNLEKEIKIAEDDMLHLYNLLKDNKL